MSEKLTPEQQISYVENTRQMAREVLRVPEVQQRLGGHAAQLYALAGAISPVVVERETVSTAHLDSKRIPTLVSRSGERIVRLAGGPNFDYYQMQTLSRELPPAEARIVLQEYEHSVNRRTNVLMPFQNELAYTSTSDAEMEDGSTVKGWPLIALNYDASRGASFASPPVVLHELAHVRHARELPVWNPNKINMRSRDLSEELEGYHIAAMIILGIQDAGLQREYLSSLPVVSMEKTLEVESIRQESNKYESDPFAGSHSVAAELIRKKYPITDFLRRAINQK